MPDFYGSFVNRAAQLRRYENSLAKSIGNLLAGEGSSLLSGLTGSPLLTRSALQGVMLGVRTLLPASYQIIHAETLESSLDIAAAQSSSLARSLRSALKTKVADLTEADLQRIARNVRINDQTLYAWEQAQQRALVQRLQITGRRALSDGLSQAQARERMRDVFDRQGRAWAETLSRTIANVVTNQASLQVAKSAGIFDYYLSVMLDGKTSTICIGWAASPGPYRIGEGSAPTPPFHYNCRTIVLFAGVGLPPVTGFNPLSYLTGLTDDELSQTLGSKHRAEQFRMGLLAPDEIIKTDKQLEVIPKRPRRPRQ